MKKLNRIKFIISALGIMIALLIVSCNKTTTPPDSEETEQVFVNNNIDDLNQRVTYIYEPVFSSSGGKSSDNYYWYYVAEVAAPVFNGETLSATHVDIIDDKAYVSYNVQGDVYMGGIEVIDLENPAYPSIITQLLFNGNDANAVAADVQGSNASRDVYLALSSFKKGAVVRKLTTQDGQFTGAFTDLSLSKSLSGGHVSASANGLSCTSDYVYATSGQTYGGVFKLNKSNFSLAGVDEYSAAKYVVTNGSSAGSKQITLSTGDNSKLHIYEVGSSTATQVYDIGAIYHQNVEEPYAGKSAMHIDQNSNICFVSKGLNGVNAYDITSGDVVYYSPAGMLTTGNTNGLTKDDLFVYFANGADGLFVGKLPSGGGEIIPVQVWDMNETGASANLVKASEDWLFVAKGGGGLKILRRIHQSFIPPVCDWDEQGLPECLETYTVCTSLKDHIGFTLPERVNAFENRPEYFLNNHYEIDLQDAAHLSVIFVSEGAGLKNTFGYYYYPTNNPPVSVDDIFPTMRIIFPNASAYGSGGYLHTGDMVQIPGNFPAGTTVGFFLLANSWNDGDITEGVYQHYTDMDLNYHGLQQSILMNDSICGCVVMGIEDILSDRGDKDFNDIVFQVLIDPETSFNNNQIVQIPPQ